MNQIAMECDRPFSFHMKIHSGMLETMGHNMYSSVAKCLAEFVANAYDADAEKVTISMNFNEIDNAKKKIRAKAREDKKLGTREDISAIYDPLPEHITITIEDDGHGMSPQEIQNYFMAITRNRRKDDQGKLTKIFTESGKRRVMGRKGVGKLAGFGASEHIKITSKRAGFNYSTSFEMDYSSIKNKDELTEAKFLAEYEENLPTESHYTIITLSQLRCDSLKSSKQAIEETLARTFCILDKNFNIYINDEIVDEPAIEWEFTYPVGSSIENLSETKVIIDADDEDSQFSIKYIVRFIARSGDLTADGQTPKRTSLPADRRGARIYSHGRIAHGPSLLKLHSGVHNFHAQDYMECIVIADAIDEFEHDCIVTSREGLHKDSPIVNALFNKVTDIMREALKEQYKHKDVQITEAIDSDEFSTGILSPLQSINKKSQKAAKEILKVIGREHGVKSKTYREMAPILLQAVNAGEVITKLIELETDPKSIQVLTHSLAELTLMEKSDLLKLYRGRTRAINALQKLYEDSLNTKKGKGYENDLHRLFKDSPWLIRPEYATYITSDKPLGDVCKSLNELLHIDETVTPQSINENDNTRPDLVFLAANQPNPDEVVIVELKSPGIELEYDHLDQLENYMFKIEEHLTTKLSKPIKTHGYLIGTKPGPKATAEGKRRLLNKIATATPNTQYKVIDILELLAAAKQIHQSGIEIFEAEEKQLTEELE